MHYITDFTLPNLYVMALLFMFCPSKYGIREALAFKDFKDISL